MRRDVQKLRRNLGSEYFPAVLAHSIGHADGILQAGEIERVPQGEQALLHIRSNHARRAQHILVLNQTGMGPAIGIDQTVHAEVAVVRVLAEIAAVEILPAAIGRGAHVDGVIAPFPDKAAAVTLMTVEAVEIVLQVSGAVAHGMAVFAKNIGLIDGLFFEIAVDFRNAGIHAAVRIQISLVDFLTNRRERGALVMRQAGRIVFLCPGQRLVEVNAHAGLIAHGPEHHAGTVFVADYTVLHTVNNDLFIGGIIGKHVIIVDMSGIFEGDYAMAFDVRFINHIEAKFIAHAQEFRRIGIMAGTDGVDVVLLHDAKVAQHLFFANSIAQHRIAVVAVYALELDGLTVDLDHAVFNIDFAEAYAICNPLSAAMQNERVQIRIFSIPLRDVFQIKQDFFISIAVEQLPAVGVKELILRHRRADGFQLNAHFAALAAKLSMHKVIAQVLSTAFEQIHIAEDAGHAELVLILKVGAHAPLQHQHSDGVFAFLDKSGHIEFRSGVGNLTEADELAVHPHIVAGINALKAQRGTISLMPVKGTGIQATGVIHRHIGRIKRNRITDIGILMPVIALRLPNRRNRDHIRRCSCAKEIFGQIQHALVIAKLPFTTEQKHAVRLFALCFQRSFFLAIGNIISAVRQRVYMEMMNILMVIGQIHCSVPPVRAKYLAGL